MSTRSGGSRAGMVAVLAGVAGCLVAASASAQQPARALPAPPPSSPTGVQPAAPAASSPPGAPAAGNGQGQGVAAGNAADVTPLPVPTELMHAQPGGITAEQAGARAAQTSWAAKASMESLRGAAARVDAAWAAFLPRLSALGKYTRLSNFTPPNLFAVGGDLVVAPPTATATPITPQQIQNNNVVGTPVNFSFPFFVLDNWLLQASLNIPISDYFLRINQTYSAATNSQDAARWDVVTARAASEANGRIAYYAWLNARGAVVVAVQALNDQKTHVRDARNQFAAGNASKADVLRAETAMASAELALERAKNLSDLTEKQLRVAMHLPEGEPMAPGEDLDAPVPPLQGNLKQMTLEAITSRPEVHSADANAAAAHEQASAAKAQRWPVLSAFGDGILGNPNPRYIPPTNVWNTTWDVGAQITWSPNDVLTANGNVRDFESRVAAIEANKNTTRDNIEVEVTQMLQGVHEADFSIESSTRELASAEEAYRVQRELFNNGRGTSTTLADAESDLTRARLDLLNAKVAARTARVRLEHALGRDTRAAAP
ncbi:MAG TPA: TolC family protein [Polyangiaceae bacterium]